MNGRTTIATEAQRYHDEKLAREMTADFKAEEQRRYHRAFMHYLTTGNDYELKDLQASIDAAGGYLSSRQFHTGVIDAMRQNSVMRRICRVLPPMSAEALEVARQDSRLTDATWTTELLIGAVDSAQPFGKVEFRPSPLAKSTKASKTLRRRGGAFAEAAITDAFGDSFATPAENAYIQGDGFGKPIGLINTPGLVTITTATSLTLAAADVDLFVYKLPGRWHANAQVLMHVDTAAVLAQLDAQGARIIQNGKLLGRYDMVFSDQMPSAGTAPAALTANTIVAVIGDFSRYWIVDAQDGLSVQVLVELYAATNQDAYIGRLETDGAVVDVGAFVALKIKP